MTPHWELAIRMLVGALLGSIIGYERDYHGRPAGLRTHMIVALASATFMVVSIHFAYVQRYPASDHLSADPSRIAASVAVGIGFLGAGAILRTGISVQGLTTAAGLWLVSAIGLAAGAGMYRESVVATAIGLMALWGLHRFEQRQGFRRRRRVTLVLEGHVPEAATIARARRGRDQDVDRRVRAPAGRAAGAAHIRRRDAVRRRAADAPDPRVAAGRARGEGGGGRLASARVRPQRRGSTSFANSSSASMSS